ncbi:MAG TPA: hypothetical protein VLA24_00050 [Pseudomonadales bacterium]|nr:hypothetical protein [Pseudomonadales bacterium]
MSPQQQRYCAGVCLVGNVLIFIAPLSFLHLSLLLVLYNLVCLYGWCSVSMKFGHSVLGIEWRDEQWRLHTDNGALPVTLVEYGAFRDLYVSLVFQAGWRRWYVPLWPDSSDGSSLRKLRIRLLHNL